jgi:hypothetical protein
MHGQHGVWSQKWDAVGAVKIQTDASGVTTVRCTFSNPSINVACTQTNAKRMRAVWLQESGLMSARVYSLNWCQIARLLALINQPNTIYGDP